MSTTFRLLTLERLRAKDLEDRARALGAATSALGEARDRLATIDAALAGRGPDRTTPGELGIEGTYRDRLRADRLDALDDVARAEADLEGAREEWLRARAKLQAVTTLHHRHRESVRAERLRREQAELDDLAGMRHRAGAEQRIPQQREAAADRTSDVPAPGAASAAALAGGEGWER